MERLTLERGVWFQSSWLNDAIRDTNKGLTLDMAFCSCHYGKKAQSGLYNVRLGVPLVNGILVSKANIESILGIELHKARDWG